MHVQRTTEQDVAFGELDELMIMHRRNIDETSMKPSKEACLKALYWPSTFITLNHLLAELLPRAMLQEEDPDLPKLGGTIINESWTAGVCAMFRKYLTGQHVLAVSAKDKAWLGRFADKQHESSSSQRLMMKSLRATAGGVITIDTLSSIDLSLKRALRCKGTVVFEEAVARVKAMFH